MRDAIAKARAAVTGNAEFEAFYGGAYRPLVGQVLALTVDHGQAEEVVQEAFVRAWLAWPRIASYDDPHAWVRKVAFPYRVSRWRRTKRLARALVTLAPAEAVPEVGPLSVAVVEARRAVPLPQRRALVLHYVCGLPIAVIAAEEACSKAP